MNKSLLVKLFGFGATLIHGDTLVWDRWRWLSRRLPRTRNGEKLLDVGSGTGAFTIGAARKGYEALGLSWDERNQAVSRERAALCGAGKASFDILDVRRLDTRTDLAGQFDFALCLEVAEHILDDFKLVRDIAACLKPGGRVLFTTPNYHYRAITRDDDGPFIKEETGWHVRRGCSPAMVREVFEAAGLVCEEVDYCSGFLSQKATWILRSLGGGGLGWLAVLPLRPFVALLDRPVTAILGYPQFSIAVQAYKPRVPTPGKS